jgi:photosystem II stability/assembly factor-like uncharacterized protein
MIYPGSIYFIDKNIGFVAGGDTANGTTKGEIRKTTDGGFTWYKLSIPSEKFISDIFFVNDSIGYAAGSSSVILKTTDAGRSWQDISYSTPYLLNSIDFLDGNTGFIAGGGLFEPVFIKTTNSGINWINISLNTSYDLYVLDFFNKNYGLVVGNRTILKTTDGGENVRIDTYNDYYLASVSIVDSINAFSCGYFTNTSGNFIIKTQNAGDNWTISYSNSIPIDLLEIKFINKNFGVVVGEYGNVIRTTNNGESWEEKRLVYEPELRDVFFIDSNTGWITGRKNKYGYIFKTSNSGVTWTLLNPPGLVSDFMLFQNYPNPFNPKTKIRYHLYQSGQVTLKIYDVIGREIITLVNGEQDRGIYEYDFDGSNFSSGIYFYKIDITTLKTFQIKSYSESKKMILLK